MSEYFTDPRAAEVFAHYEARHQTELALTGELSPGSMGALSLIHI